MSVRALVEKYKEPLLYIVFGAATTGVNYGVYFLFTRIFQIHYLPANILAWLAAVLFAFLTNKLFVFHSKSWHPDTVFPELWKFTAARVFSGLLETGILWLCVDLMHLNDGVIKLLAGVIVVLLNYVFSKCFIFRKGE